MIEYVSHSMSSLKHQTRWLWSLLLAPVWPLWNGFKGTSHQIRSANFLWLICKAQIRKFLQNTAQLCFQTVPKIVFVNFFRCKFELQCRVLYALLVRRNRLYLWTWGSLKSANHKQKDRVRKSQIRKVPHLRKVRKSFKLLNPQTCGFVICRTYLRTAHFWKSTKDRWPMR